MSIEGSAPSIVQARGIAQLFNRPTSYRVAQTTEQARTAEIDSRIKRDQVVAQTALLFLDAARWARVGESIRPQVDALARAAETVQLRVREGRELEIEAKRAALAVAKTRHRLAQIEQEQDFAEASLGVVLGYAPHQRPRPVKTDTLGLPTPDTEQQSVEQALRESRDLRRLESTLLAKRHEQRAYRAARLPTIDLVAQYALFGKFNNYEDFFRRFDRHNWQIGASIQVPVVPSSALSAQSAQAETEISGLQTQLSQLRSRIAVDTQNAFRRAKLAETTRDLARQDLALSREQVDILLAQLEEGRATLRQLENARFEEQEHWIAFFDAQFGAERARVDLLSLTGTLLAALQ
jgi:outer membrane protein TolC